MVTLEDVSMVTRLATLSPLATNLAKYTISPKNHQGSTWIDASINFHEVIQRTFEAKIEAVQFSRMC
ncbi:hypothetical protein TNCV_356751 [Trichonephila clavipes]|nr:hypothetical protein TNCV_356751 [Trichonephila clavipes]